MARSNEGTRPKTHANHVATATIGDDSVAAANAVAAVKQALGESLGKPGTDPSPFLPELRSLKASLRALMHVQQAWEKAVKTEAKGLIHDVKVFETVKDVGKHEKAIPLMLTLKCKINKCGLINESKGRMEFQGNLHTPKGGMDSWNPHATLDSLKLFLGCCARDDIDIVQVDSVMEHVQTEMREHSLEMLPEELKQTFPKDMWKWIDVQAHPQRSTTS